MSLPILLSLATISQLLTALTLRFTPTTSTLPRLATAAVAVYLAVLFDHEVKFSFQRPSAAPLRNWLQTCTVFAWWLTGRNITDLCLSRLRFGTFGGALYNIVNDRGVGTEFQVPNLRSPGSNSRARELLRHARNLCTSYLVIDVLGNQPHPPNAFVQNTSFLAIGSSDEVIFRLALSIGFWVSIACTMTLVYSVLMLILTMCNAAASSPPAFGRFAETYTVRRFWSKFWHRFFRRQLVAISGFVAHRLLFIPDRRTLLARYSKLFVTFLLSGLVHRTGEVPPFMYESGVVQFFLGSAVCILVEDGVQHVFQDVGGAKWKRLVGYAWVLIYLNFMTPLWALPHAREARPEDKLLPFSVVGYCMQSVSK